MNITQQDDGFEAEVVNVNFVNMFTCCSGILWVKQALLLVAAELSPSE